MGTSWRIYEAMYEAVLSGYITTPVGMYYMLKVGMMHDFVVLYAVCVNIYLCSDNGL